MTTKANLMVMTMMETILGDRGDAAGAEFDVDAAEDEQ